MESVSASETAVEVPDMPGIAKIKPEYLIVDHVRKIKFDFVANADKAEHLQSNNQNREPPRKKLKGQNKHRPRESRIPRAEKLCLKFLSEDGCPYGATCCYSHDLSTFMDKKPPDIGSHCYIFETFGRCPYSFTCRFASQHFVENKNIVNEELWTKHKSTHAALNSLSKSLQVSLRKRHYDFKKTAEVLKLISNGHYKTILSKKSDDKIPCKSAICDKVDKNLQQDSNETVHLQSESHVINPTSENSALSDSCDGSETPDVVPCGKNINATVEDNQAIGCLTDEDIFHIKPGEKKKIDFRDKLFLAPLTTVGNLPFRRICKEFGADITCGEMAMAANLLQGQQSEWALLKRHSSEDIFGVQICGPHPDLMTRCAQLLSENISMDFVDINMGCPIDLVYQKGAGCGLMGRVKKLEEMIFGMSSVLTVPLTVKMRTGIHENKNIAHNVISRICDLGDKVDLITLHGRSREQRYTRLSDWDYIDQCAKAAHPIPLFGCGDILSYEDMNLRREQTSVAGCTIARAALIKPWLFTEIKEQRHWDISSSERYDIIKKFSNYGLQHWGSDTEGIEKTRRFLLEWLSFLHRYIPVGLLQRVPQKINERPPHYYCRDDMETLMASPSCSDWIKISEMLLGPVPDNFVFLPKHKANAYK